MIVFQCTFVFVKRVYVKSIHQCTDFSISQNHNTYWSSHVNALFTLETKFELYFLKEITIINDQFYTNLP